MPKCSIEGCDKESDRTISIDKAGIALKEEGLVAETKKKKRKFHICKDHYRRIKKHMKKDRKLDRARWL